MNPDDANGTMYDETERTTLTRRLCAVSETPHAVVEMLDDVRGRIDAANDDIGVSYSIPADEWHLVMDKPSMLTLRVARVDMDRMERALRAVLALHAPQPHTVSALFPSPLCRCGYDHPCPTGRAITEALG